MAIVLRPYKTTDINDITSVIKAAFSEYSNKLTPPSSAEKKSPEVVRQELQTRHALVVTEHNKLVASVFYQQKDDSVYIDRLAVLPSHQKQGIATQVMQELELRARDLGATSLSLSVRLVLEKQQAFYKKLGFVFDSFGTHEGFSEATFMTMRKTL